jgi:branched-chain amino acid transport system ATP-binding protein
MTDAPALELSSVTAGYGSATVLHGIDLTVASGSVVALLGPNGAGKTTLLRVASGLLTPRSGSVSVGGHIVTKQRPAKRARAGVCLIPEGRGVFPGMTVRENLRLQIPPRARESTLDAALAVFPVLGERLDERAGRMSGGQQQMLALARAWIARPSVVLLDEVSMGLAPRIVDEIFAALRRLAETGTALLLVEQYVDRALDLADVVYLLDRGVVRYSGDASSLDRDAVLRSYLHVDATADEPVDAGQRSPG